MVFYLLEGVSDDTSDSEKIDANHNPLVAASDLTASIKS
jgi:hypothetical protein